MAMLPALGAVGAALGWWVQRRLREYRYEEYEYEEDEEFSLSEGYDEDERLEAHDDGAHHSSSNIVNLFDSGTRANAGKPRWVRA
jgi:hypothetical protein